MKNSDYQMCSNCVMDNVQDETIKFDDDGVCEYCHTYQEKIEPSWNHGVGHEKELEQLLNTIRESGKGKEYDCLLGFSGGMDSAYLLHMAVTEWKLRPLVFHIDSGFDLDIGKDNINKMVSKLGIELHTEKVDFEDIKNFQIACFRTGLAGCLDMPQDHAFVSVLDHFAVENNIKYILNGYNTSTEFIANPKTHSKNSGHGTDPVFIKDVLNRHSPKKIKNYKFTNVFRRKIILPYFKGVHVVKPLDLIPYEKKNVLDLLINEYDYTPYDQKHFESMMTKFIEGFWLPKRFGFDVRNHQLSSLIITGQMSREEALNILSKPALTEEEEQELFTNIANKLDISQKELLDYFNMPKWNQKYRNINWVYELGGSIMRLLKLDNRIRK